MAYQIMRPISIIGRAVQFEDVEQLREYDIQAPGFWGLADTKEEAILVAHTFGPHAQIFCGWGEDYHKVEWTYVEGGSC